MFADLDLPNPYLALVKAGLVGPIRWLTQAKAGELLGLDQRAKRPAGRTGPGIGHARS